MDVMFAELDDVELRRRLAELLLPYLEGPTTSSTAQLDPWFDTKQTAEYLGITRDALYKHTAARTIPFEQEAPGCKCWFKRSDLDAWRRGQTPNAAKAQPRSSNSTFSATPQKRKLPN
jgi:excisionase family DNA binding protein